MPFVPHLAYECLELLNCKAKNVWPEIKKNTIEIIKMAVQVNGKTRDIIQINKDMSEKYVNEFIMKNSKAKIYIADNNVKRVIFIKDKIINYIT